MDSKLIANWHQIRGSTNIAAIGYIRELELCFVEFLDGSIYIYPGVNERTWHYFLESPSKGSFRHRYLKFGIKVFNPTSLKSVPAEDLTKGLRESLHELKQ